MWLMPVLVVLFAALEYIMFLLYNQYGHPWKEILKAALEVENKLLNLAPNWFPLLKALKVLGLKT